MSDILHGLPPLVDTHSRILIFGSFPSGASLAAGMYYARRQNQFWRVLGAVLDEPLNDMAYAERQQALRRARIGIWDVYASCERSGSLDSAIRNGQVSDFASLKRQAPELRRVCFNGKTAARFERTLQSLGYETFVLPSTSPAYTLAFEKKLALWREALAGV